MKYTITINQIGAYMAGLQDSLDLIDLAIIDYLSGWVITEKKKTLKLENEIYTWINYKHLLTEMPLLKIKSKSKAALTKRLHKLEVVGLLKLYQEGQKIYFSITDYCVSTCLFSQDTVHKNERSVHDGERSVHDGEQHPINNHNKQSKKTINNYGCKSFRLASSAIALKEFLNLSREEDINPEAIETVEYFLKTYCERFGKAHPNLRPEQWQKHLNTILECRDDQDRLHNFTSSCLEEMIDSYFSIDTFWPDCDYSINHFNTDGIKSRRMFEAGAECF